MSTLEPAASWQRGATNRHYDQSPEFFRNFLDSLHMKYSPGLFEGQARSLEEAQTAKLRYIADCLGVRPGARVLDVGCGWGSLSCFLAREVGCHVLSITPAANQAEHVMRRAVDLDVARRLHVKVGHFPDEVPLDSGSFDAVAYVGSITHIRDKAGALRRTFELLRSGGHVYISESCFRNAALRKTFENKPGTQFVLEETFGFAELNPVSDYVVALEDAGFSLVALRDLTEEFRRTIEAWADNVQRNRAALEALSEGSVERLLHYFSICNTGWGYTTKQYALVARRGR